MKIGFLFPGQGSQYVGMGKDLYDSYDEVKAIYDEIYKITDMDIAKLTFESSEEELTQTKNTQLAILAMSLGILKILETKGIKADVVTGLSLGEYTSLIYANSINFEDGILLVKKRGEYMQNMLPEGKWSMAAFLGAEEQVVIDICRNINSGFIVPVNFNCPGQIVVSGEKKAILEAIDIAKEIGIRVKELNTSGPFHTEKLIDAANLLRIELENANINEPKCSVLKNINGEIYSVNDDVKDILYTHMISPVRFDKCIEKMLDMGVDTFVEIGPGKTLTSFVKRANKDVNLVNINNVETLKTALSVLVN